MPANDSLRIAIRKFGPFESAIRKQWDAFCAITRCPLRLEADALDLHDLHGTLFEGGGLREGRWDIGFISTDWVAEAHATGALRDLAPLIEADPPEDYPQGWTDSLLRHQRFGQVVLGFPYHDGPECLIYRRDLFDALELQPPRTWEEFHMVARRLSDPTGSRWGTVFAAYPDGHNTVYDFCLQLWTRGGELFDGNGRLNINTPIAEAALTFYRDILNDNQATHPESRKFDSVQSGLAFARGEVAMMVNWFGFAALGETLQESRVKGRVAVTQLPADPGRVSASLNAYWLLGIGYGSAHADIAYEFIRFCCSAANDKLLTLEGAIGCRKSTWADLEVSRAIPFYRSLESLHMFARELPRFPNWVSLASIIDRLVLGSVDSHASIQDLLAEAQLEADQWTDSGTPTIKRRSQGLTLHTPPENLTGTSPKHVS